MMATLAMQKTKTWEKINKSIKVKTNNHYTARAAWANNITGFPPRVKCIHRIFNQYLTLKLNPVSDERALRFILITLYFSNRTADSSWIPGGTGAERVGCGNVGLPEEPAEQQQLLLVRDPLSQCHTRRNHHRSEWSSEVVNVVQGGCAYGACYFYSWWNI